MASSATINRFRAPVLLLCTLSFVAVFPLSAAQINIFNTGVNNGGTASSGSGPLLGGAADTHWTCSVNCSGSAFQAVGATPAEHAAFSSISTGWPVPFTQNSSNNGNGPWVASALSGTRSLSQWISSQSDVAAIMGALEYDYSETFDLTGFIAATAELKGLFASDNFILGIFVNGVLVTGTANTGGLSFKTAFDLVNGVNGVVFNAGMNTITFKTQDGKDPNPNPTGLLVEFTSATAGTSGVPEPATLFGVGLGLSLVGLIYRRRRS